MVGTNQNKYLIVVINYYTKWIEAKVLSIITVQNFLHFYKKNILSTFGVPQSIITNIKTQLTDKKI